MNGQRIVIIGEDHPNMLEHVLVKKGELNVKLDPLTKRYVVDRSADYDKTKNWIKRINKEIIQEERKILRKEKIARLFIEDSASLEKKGIYSIYKGTHDLTKLRFGLRHANVAEGLQIFYAAKKLLERMKMEDWLRKDLSKGISCEIKRYEKHPESFLANALMFGLAHAVFAHNEGVYDIIPMDPEEQRKESIALQLIRDLCRRVEFEFYAPGLKTVYGGINARLGSMKEQREELMCKIISEAYVPGSAVICGNDHAINLGRLLSEAGFDVKPYRVGEALSTDVKKS